MYTNYNKRKLKKKKNKFKDTFLLIVLPNSINKL